MSQLREEEPGAGLATSGALVSCYVALLRAVNVGGQNTVAMPTLRARLADAGYRDVSTYLQSGNVVLRTGARLEATLTRALEEEIRAGFGLTISVLVRSSEQWETLVARNPYARRGTDPKTWHVTVLADQPAAGQVKTLAARGSGPDEAVVRGREVYLQCPNGYGRTKLTNTFLERHFATVATTRNWRTVTTILDLMRA